MFVLNAELDEIERLIIKYDPDEKFKVFLQFFVWRARHVEITAQNTNTFREACQVSRDLLILDEDLEGLGLEEMVDTWEEALDIKYGEEYMYKSSSWQDGLCLVE